MDYQKMTLDQLKDDLIVDGKKGYPFFLAGAVYWLIMGGLGFIMGVSQQLALIYIIGMASIFPLAIMIGKVVGSNILSKNPLGVLGGIIGGIQAFFIPVWIIIYMEHYELIPMTVGILAASHFLPYLWIYRSKSYLILTVLMAVISLIFGYVFIELAFSILPLLLAVLYLVTVISLRMETKTFVSVLNADRTTSAE